MKVRRITLLLLSFVFIPSEAGEWTEWKRSKLNDNEVHRESVESAESSAFCPGCSDSEVNPLKWVTNEEWEDLPGGKSGNPVVKMKGAPDRDDCAAFGQVSRNGCWQTGCLAYDETGNYWKALMAAWDGGHFFGYWPNGGGARFLVNPGNSVSISWVDWKRGNGPFPANTVYGDPTCKLAVATYYDSSSVWAYNNRQGAQVDKAGYVYWQDKTFDGEWQYDSNEYELLTVNSVSRAIVKEFRIIPQTKKCSGEDEKVSTSVATTHNHLDQEVTKKLTLTFKGQTRSTYDHSINWKAGIHGQFELGAEPVKVTAGFTLNTEDNRKFGNAETTETTFSQAIEYKVQPGQTIEARMVARRTVCSFDYIAKVKLTYVTGQTRDVEDRGTFEGVQYGDFDTDVRDLQDKPTNVPIPTIVDYYDDLG